MDNVALASIEDRCAEEIASAYKALCAMMLVQTASAFRRKPCSRKDLAKERNAAQKWVTNSDGVLTFAECCEAMGMDEERVRRLLAGLAEAERIRPINRVVFGVRIDAHLTDADSRGGGSHGPECETGGLH